ncbi:MAG: M15 family metallopeptidase [Acidimicrobiales bacterium]
MPRFDEPLLTQPGKLACSEVGVAPPRQKPLPALIEPETLPLVDTNSTEKLVQLSHPKIQTLQNYRLAGWGGARPGTWLRVGAAERLYAIAHGLPDRWGLCVFDAWRPLDLQAELYDAAYSDPNLPPGFVSMPDSDPRTPPPHLTGGTVDLSLTLDDTPLALGTGFDDFTDLARAAALETTVGVDRDLRRWLYWLMRSEGFVVLECEWWHFEYGTRRWAAITTNAPVYGPADAPISEVD